MRLTAAPPTDMRPTTPTPMAACPATRTGGRAGEGVARPGPDTRFSSGEAAAGWPLPVSRRVAGFMGVDVIRMHFKKIPSLILLLNFYIYIILLLKIDNSIIIGLKIMNLNILLLNF